MIYLSVIIFLFVILDLRYEFFFLPYFAGTLITLLNILIIYTVFNSNIDRTKGNFLNILVLISFVFLFLMFQNYSLHILAYILILFIAYFLLCFILSLFGIVNGNFPFFIQSGILLASIVVFFTNINNTYTIAMLIFINFISIFLLCFWNYKKIKKTNYIKKTASILLIISIIGFLPYLIFTFLPKFILNINYPMINNDYALYLVLLLPISYTFIIMRERREVNHNHGITLLLDLVGLTIFIVIINILIYLFFDCKFEQIFLFDNCMLVILILYNFYYNIQFLKRQKKLHAIIGGFESEKAEILANYEKNQQTDKFLNIIYKIVSNSFPCDGIMIVSPLNKLKSKYLLRTGTFENYELADNELVEKLSLEPIVFYIHGVKCLAKRINIFDDKSSYIIVSIKEEIILNSDEFSIFKNIADSIGDLLSKYFLIEKYQNKNLIQRYSISERVAYIERMDFAYKEKENCQFFYMMRYCNLWLGLKT